MTLDSSNVLAIARFIKNDCSIYMTFMSIERVLCILECGCDDENTMSLSSILGQIWLKSDSNISQDSFAYALVEYYRKHGIEKIQSLTISDLLCELVSEYQLY